MMFKYLIIHCCAGSYHFRNSPFYNAFCQFGIFQLIANRHAVTGFYQFMQISIQCMMGKPGQFQRCSSAIISFGKGDAQHL